MSSSVVQSAATPTSSNASSGELMPASGPIGVAVVGQLPLHGFQVDRMTPLRTIVGGFLADPAVPGAIVMHSQPSSPQPIAIVARQAFFEGWFKWRRNKTPGTRLGDRPIADVLAIADRSPLIVPETTAIAEVMLQAMQRLPEFRWAPIGIQSPEGAIRLLDMRDLILAHHQQAVLQSQAPESQMVTSQAVEAQAEQLRTCQAQLEHTQQALLQANQAIDVRNLALQTHQQHLERQQATIFHQTREIKRLKAQLQPVQHLLDDRASPMLQRLLDSVTALTASIDQLINTSVSLAKEFETVNTTSSLIQQVCKQARFLGLHTAILVNRFSGEGLDGFSRLTSDVTRLANQTVEADRRMGEMVHRIKANIAALAQVSQTSATATQTLMQQVGEVESLWADLAELLGHSVPVSDPLRLSLEQKSDLRVMRSLLRRVEQVSHSLVDLYTNSTYSDLRLMLRSIERHLGTSRGSLLAARLTQRRSPRA